MTRKGSIKLEVKRIYEPPADSDGCRILVDRIWPRGLSKEEAMLDAWIKDIAPSTELRIWYGHEPSRWTSFKRKYFRELDEDGDVLERLLEVCPTGRVTLLFAAKDVDHNNAAALKEYLERALESKGRR